MSDPSSISNVPPTGPAQIIGTPAPVAPHHAAGKEAATVTSFSTISSVGDLQRNAPELWKLIQQQAVVYVKRVQDRALRRIKANNREANRD